MVTSSDALGLAGLLPGPGWVILDAARDQRFTGEVVALADEEVRVYFDRGRIYVAERASDPPLGTRLVDAGALNRAQLEYGTLKIGSIEHLGRLFDRVPSVNRDGVLVVNELMTEQCVRWLAARQLHSVTATPYRHHESGMHRWEIVESASVATAGGVPPEIALPAPPPDALPVIAAVPAEPTETTADAESSAPVTSRATETVGADSFEAGPTAAAAAADPMRTTADAGAGAESSAPVVGRGSVGPDCFGAGPAGPAVVAEPVHTIADAGAGASAEPSAPMASRVVGSVGPDRFEAGPAVPAEPVQTTAGAGAGAESSAPVASRAVGTVGFDRFDQPTDLLDDVVEWDEPSTLSTGWRRPAAAEREPRDLLADPEGYDWIDALDHSGVANAPTVSARQQLAPLDVRRAGQFELIWPSGETDDLTDGGPTAPPGGDPVGPTGSPDDDRVGPTVRVPEPAEPAEDAMDVEPLPVRSDRGRRIVAGTGPDIDQRAERAAAAEADLDTQTTLAVRRAVATIDTGSLDARRRLADAPIATSPPGRLVVEREHHLWRTDREHATTSVFDEQPVVGHEPVAEVASQTDDHDERAGALRRLISSLRRS